MPFKFIKVCFVLLLFTIACQKKVTVGEINVPPKTDTVKSDVSFYLTTADRSSTFQKQNVPLNFSSNISNQGFTIEVNENISFQTMEGFGYTLTGGSASLINSLDATIKENLLKELFSTDGSGIGISYIRVSLGASDLSFVPYTYDDISPDKMDLNLSSFTLDRERADLIPILKKITEINPQIKILASPWSAPLWMKTNGSFVGGKLKPEYYGVYADYFVRYIQAMKSEGIVIDAITPQNEPLHPGNNPSMLMLAAEQAEFIKNNLGPAFSSAGITAKIIIYDHNADRPDYPISILNDPEAKKYIEGSAFHLYGGDITALSTVHSAHPDKGIYFTEQWVGGPGDFAGDLKWHVSNLIIGASRNWSQNVLEWNLAADSEYKPHTAGGCTNCLGALTIGSNVTRNVSYYIIAHASKFVRPGSLRIESTNSASIQNVAFKTPEGKIVLIVLNSGNASQNFSVKFRGKAFSSTLAAGSVATFYW